ncbi:GAF and ANTAR domain-containing protein [Streptomyces venezuelae]|uniref:GAF domain-containing protein n=1 Tax=Streptomyces venezuelae TaxID=54571 RepID=A0A5P2BF44_STRVZ|nr:GAF and ANTAR domain-containing protein [Streptomyces venezuelae]QES28358.1 GAF domain-containing protein [Streptomyces venezuelae]
MEPQGYDEALGLVSTARGRASRALDRAERAAASAARHEHLAASDPDPDCRKFHTHVAQTHRRSAACHRSFAVLHAAFADRTSAWVRGKGSRPRFMTGVAEALGTASAAITLVDSAQNQLAVAVSDEPALSAQDLEFVLGEGPSRDAAYERRPVHSAGAQIERRWPGYGPVFTSMGFTSVLAVPLETQAGCFGSLAVFDPRAGLLRSTDLAEVTAALTRIVLLGPDADPELYGGTDHRDVVQQAVGVLSVRIGCGIADALALIKARAFADETTTAAIARRILNGDPYP